ncbi:uncharacterized protein UDID_07171 [Ustilago sp. UG-2017a]|nr:uncharacterized protein UDID_07171 [Ustilago sp. UG-2017a]
MDEQGRAADDTAQPGSPTDQLHNTNLPVPPSASSLSVRTDYDDNGTGYITASSSRLSQLDNEPLTNLLRIHLHSSTPAKRSSIADSPLSDSMATTAASTSNDTSHANLASLSSVTTFVPSTLTDSDSSDQDDNAERTSSDGDTTTRNRTEESIPSYDFDLCDPHERTVNRIGQDEEEDASIDHDQTLAVRDAMEGDIITISHSHSTSMNTYNVSIPHSRSASQPDTSRHHQRQNHSFLPASLSTSWPSLALPPSAIKLHKRRRNILLRLLKTWEGREQVLHFSHSLILLLYSSLDHPVPQTYRGAMLRPAGTVLALSFPKPVRVALMQRIYTTAEGVDNFRRVILIARWVTATTEAAMEHWQQRQASKKRGLKMGDSVASREELIIKLTGDEPFGKLSDHVEDGLHWLQPPNLATFDASEEGQGGAEKGFTDAPAAKLGKITGRGDATGAIGANAAEDAGSGSTEKDLSEKNKTKQSSTKAAPTSASSYVIRTLARLWTSVWKPSHLEAAAESFAAIGEACETAAALAGGGMFWRAVGIQKLGIPFLSGRRRQGIERLGIVLSLCSMLLSLLVLRIERKALRSELRSAHRRIIRANDKLGWASDLAGKTINRDQALSNRKRDPSRSSRGRIPGSEAAPLEMLGPDLQKAARDLDDQALHVQRQSGSDESSSLSSSESSLSDTWTVVPDTDDAQTHPTANPLVPARQYHSSQNQEHGEDPPRRRGHRSRDADGEPKSINVDSLIKSTERSLVRAESDLRNTRRRMQLNFWEKVANWSQVIFLSYEAAMPHVDKDAFEGSTGLVASTIRLMGLWKELSWS